MAMQAPLKKLRAFCKIDLGLRRQGQGLVLGVLRDLRSRDEGLTWVQCLEIRSSKQDSRWAPDVQEGVDPFA